MTQLSSPGLVRQFILGGNATFSLQNADGSHVTYKVKSNKKNKDKFWTTNNQDKSLYFVSVLTGPNNDSDFQYLGLLKLFPIDGFYHFEGTKGSRIGRDAPSYKLFKQLWIGIEQQCRIPSVIQFYHEGQCCICGRKLTVPESIAKGIGPECEGRE